MGHRSWSVILHGKCNIWWSWNVSFRGRGNFWWSWSWSVTFCGRVWWMKRLGTKQDKSERKSNRKQDEKQTDSWSLRRTENPVWAGPAAHWLVAMYTFYISGFFFLWNFCPACLGCTCRIFLEGHDCQQSDQKNMLDKVRVPLEKKKQMGLLQQPKDTFFWYVLCLFIPFFFVNTLLLYDMIRFYLFLIHQLGPQCHIVPQPYTFCVGFDSVWPSKDYVIRVAEDRSKGALDIYSVCLDKFSWHLHIIAESEGSADFNPRFKPKVQKWETSMSNFYYFWLVSRHKYAPWPGVGFEGLLRFL